jgi:hypothetical protein
MRKTLSIFLFLLLSMATYSNTYGQSKQTTEAVKSIDKIRARTEVGISQIDYARMVADSLVDVKEIDGKSPNEEAAKIHLLMAIEYHKMALMMWDIFNSYQYKHSGFVDASSQGGKEILKLIKSTDPNSNLLKYAGTDNLISLNEIMPIYWKKADEEVNQAKEIIQKKKKKK